MGLPPWLAKLKGDKSEKEEPAHKGKKGSFEKQEKKAHGGKIPSKKAEMSEPEHKKMMDKEMGKMAKDKGKKSVRDTLKKMKGKKCR